MRDFNTVCSELVKHLRLSVQRQDGEIWWYEGTLELMTELLSFAEPFNNLSKPFKTNADRIRSMSDEELCDEYFRILNHELWRYADSRSGLLGWLRQEVTP